MGFFEANKKFIEQKLQLEIENLNVDLKLKKYLKIKDEVRLRISRSYKTIITANTERGQFLNRYFFYKDLITYVGQFESDYILTNLFLESDFYRLLDIFEKEQELSSFLANQRRIKPSYLIIFLIYFVESFNLIKKEDISINSFEIQIKKYFQSTLSANNELWCSENYYSKESINKLYPSFVLAELSKIEINWRLIVFNHLLFIKAWNTFEYFESKTNTKRALILNEFKHHFLDNNSPIKDNLRIFDKKISLFHSAIFINKVKSPFFLLDDEKLKPIKESFINTIPKLVKGNQILFNSISKKSYNELREFIERKKGDEQIKFFIFLELVNDLNKKDEDLIDEINIKIKELNKVHSILKFWRKRNELTKLYKCLSINRNKFNMAIEGLKKTSGTVDTTLVLLNKCIDIKIKLNHHISQDDLTSIIRNNSRRLFIIESKRLILKKFYLFEYL